MTSLCARSFFRKSPVRHRLALAVVVVSLAFGAATVAWAYPSRSSSGHTALGYLGVEVRDVSEEQVSTLKLKDTHGAEIVRLDHDGPACKAGVREHDVVVSMDGRAVESREQFRGMLHDVPAGQVVTLAIVRDGQQQVMKATMANREEVERMAWEQHIAVIDPDEPVAHAGGGSAGLGFLHGPSSSGVSRSHGFLGTMLGAPYTGAVVEPVTPQLGEFFGVQSGVGLLVKSVDPNSPAATAGMHAGDVVIKANQATMSSESDWTRSLHDNKGRGMPVLVLREKKEQTLMLTPDAKRKARSEAPATLDTSGSSNDLALAHLDLLHGKD